LPPRRARPLDAAARRRHVDRGAADPHHHELLDEPVPLIAVDRLLDLGLMEDHPFRLLRIISLYATSGLDRSRAGGGGGRGRPAAASHIFPCGVRATAL